MPTAPTRRTVAAVAGARLLVASLGVVLLFILALVVGTGAGPATAIAIAIPASATATATEQPRPKYVALGDSYAAGLGVPPYSELPASGCFQSTANYPHRVAEALNLDLDDRSCSGAVSANIRDTPQSTGGTSAPVQSDSLSPDTDVVTVSIGGNDLGFAAVTTACLAATADGPLLLHPDAANCRSLYVREVGGAEVDDLETALESTVAPDLAATVALIAEKAPNARIVVVGYPSLVPDAANTPATGCFTPVTANGAFLDNAFPFTAVDTEYLDATEARLDAALRAAAEGAGATYLSTLDETANHSACSTTAPFISGVTLEAADPDSAAGTPGVSARPGALHPNEAGVAFLATTVGAAVAAALDDEPGDTDESDPSSSASPTPDRADSPSTALDAAGRSPLPLTLSALLVLAAAAIAAIVARIIPRRP